MGRAPNKFENPFRPGAGHTPPHLAGRQGEQEEFSRLLKQTIILENLVLTGLRGTGKTVLLDTFKPTAMEAGWLWAGADLSESVSVSEDRLAIRLMVDLAVVTSSFEISVEKIPEIGFSRRKKFVGRSLDFEVLRSIFEQTPGLTSDKIKAVLEFVWHCLGHSNAVNGIVFAYDEAQNLSNRTSIKNEYPLSLMLDVFQSIQKKGIPFMLALSGLPTLFPRLVEARTFAERMFRVVTLQPLNEAESREAITKPIKDAGEPFKLFETEVKKIIQLSGGYPYFIQFIGREVFDFSITEHINKGKKRTRIPFETIIRKLDDDFFAGRWARATDRQRELLSVIAQLKNHNSEFTVQEIVELSKARLGTPFSPSHTNQMLGKLIESGLIFKNRHGKYAFAVPLLGDFILRLGQQEDDAA